MLLDQLAAILQVAQVHAILAYSHEVMGNHHSATRHADAAERYLASVEEEPKTA
jgi:hypothetical protein